MPTVLYLTILFALFLSMPALAQIQYQFQDQPRPEADVVVVNHTLQVRGSADLWMVGRVFNRGLKPARNVRVVPLLTNLYGSRLPTNTIYLNPSDVSPTSPRRSGIDAGLTPRAAMTAGSS